MVSSGIEPLVLPFRGGPYEGHTRSFPPGDRVYPWVILGPVRTDAGHVTTLHALYEIVMAIDQFGQTRAFFQFMRLIEERKLRSKRFAIRIRPQVRMVKE